MLARPDGSGILEIPIAAATEDCFTLEDLRDIVANFKRTNAIVVGVSEPPHLDLIERGAAQPAFVESLELRGSVLWARIDCDAQIFAKRKMYRGFSVETRRNTAKGRGLPEAWDRYDFKGWVLVGGVFTNRPALPAVFKIAADISAVDQFTEMSITDPPEGAKEETRMSEEKTISLASYDAKVAELSADITGKQDRITRLEGQQESLQTEVATLRRKNEELETESTAAKNDCALAKATTGRLEQLSKKHETKIATLETEKTELEVQLRTFGQERDKLRILSIRDAAKEKVAPAHFDGFDEDPVKFVSENYASIDAFENRVRVLCAVGDGKPLGTGLPKSGHDPAKPKSDREETSITEAELKVLAQHGGTDFINVTNEAEARAAFEARKAAQK